MVLTTLMPTAAKGHVITGLPHVCIVGRVIGALFTSAGSLYEYMWEEGIA